jgi:capsid protein
MFALGLVEVPAGAPGFYEALPAYARAFWIGPGRGYIDPVKERQASAIGLENNLTTLERELAEQGLDLEEVLAQRAREQVALAEYELAPALAAAFSDAPSDEDEEG